MYTIIVNYDTGDSFTTQSGLKDKVGFFWDKEEDANEALSRIEKHYKAYRKETGYHNEGFKVSSISNEPWFYKGEYEDYWKYRVIVPDGKGGNTTINAFWCGYFEHPNYAEVVIEGKKVEF